MCFETLENPMSARKNFPISVKLIVMKHFYRSELNDINARWLNLLLIALT